MTRKKILLISPSSGRGGAESVLLDLIESASKKFDLYLLTHRGDNELLLKNKQIKHTYVTKFFNGALELDLNLLNLILFPIGCIKNFILACKIIRKEKIDIVISNSSTIFYPALAARVLGRKSIIIFHEVINNRFLKNMLFKINRKCANKLIFNSNFLTSCYPDSNKTKVIPLSLSESKFKKLANLTIEKHHELIIGQVGKIYTTKGTDLFLKVADESKAVKPISFNVYGDVLDHKYFLKLKKLAENIQAPKRFHFEPYKKIKTILGEIDVMAVTSRFETFGLVILESMAAGIPVVSFKVGVAGEVIRNGVNGFLVENYNTSAMAEIIDKIGRGAIDLKSISKNAKTTISKQYVGSFAEKLITELEKI